MITKEQVNKIATLVKLDVRGSEDKLAQILGETIDYMKIIDEVDTADVSETFQVTGLKDVYQKESEVDATLPREDALKNASEAIKNLFATEAVFDR